MNIVIRLSAALLIGLLASCTDALQAAASDLFALQSSEPSAETPTPNPIATKRVKDPFHFQILQQPSNADWNLFGIHQREMRLKGIQTSASLNVRGMFRVADRENFRVEDVEAALKKVGLARVRFTEPSPGRFLFRGGCGGYG